MNIKSTFDSGIRSDINGLPPIPDIIRFMEALMEYDPNLSYTRQELTEYVADEFDIPPAVKDATEGCKTTLFQTRMNYILCDAIRGERENHISDSPIIGEPWAKRIGVNTYQHISGPDKAIPTIHHESKPTTSPSTPLNAAIEYFKYARRMNYSIGDAMILVANDWDADTRVRAASVAFS